MPDRLHEGFLEAFTLATIILGPYLRYEDDGFLRRSARWHRLDFNKSPRRRSLNRRKGRNPVNYVNHVIGFLLPLCKLPQAVARRR